MANMSDFLECKLIDHIMRGVSYSVVSTIGIALVTTAPNDASTGATIAEVTGGSYARVSLAPTTANWTSTNSATGGVSSGTGGTTSNASAINFTTSSADWGTVVGVAICDSTTTGAGNVLFWGTLSSNRVVSSGDSFSFLTSSLSVQIDN